MTVFLTWTCYSLVKYKWPFLGLDSFLLGPAFVLFIDVPLQLLVNISAEVWGHMGWNGLTLKARESLRESVERVVCCTITNYIHWYVFIPFFLSFLFFIPLFLSSCSLHYFLSLSLAFHMTCILCKVWRAFISVLLPFMWIAAGAVALRSYSYTSKRHMCKIFRIYLRINSRDRRTYFPYRRNGVFFASA